MTEVVAALLCLQLRLFSSGDIDADAEDAFRLAICIEVHATPHCDPADYSVRQYQAVLRIVIFSSVDCVVDRLSDPVAIFGVYTRDKVFESDFSQGRPT